VKEEHAIDQRQRMLIESLTIDARFRGPPRSGNGGYTCGLIASHLHAPAVSVRLQAPPPLQTELRLETGASQAQLFHGERSIGVARTTTLELPVPPCPSIAAAEQASSKYIGFHSHSFPGCFVCGPDRPGQDGLAIFAGPLGEDHTIASPWTPDESLADSSGAVKPEYLWAALDCPGAFAWFPLAEGMAIVLGELTVTLEGSLQAGQRAIVLGWPISAEGRKRLSGTAIYGADGRLVAKARAVWLEVPLSSWSDIAEASTAA
jgi:hypothetical protein